MNLKTVFAASGITCVHIIDDAFDKSPDKAPEGSEIQVFLDNSSNEDLEAIATSLNIRNDEEDIRKALGLADNFSKLYLDKPKLSDNSKEALFGDFERYRSGKLSLIQPLIDLLTGEGLNCIPFGAAYDPSSHPIPQLVFIDLKLKDSNPVVDHKDAVQVVATLRSKVPQCKPFVFLMSSLSVHLPLQREPFRKDAELFQSEFEAVDKATFSDATALSVLLASNTRAIPQIGKLRDSINLLESSLGTAFQSVMEELRALDLADYFVLYHNTVAIEKTTIGSYIVELLLEFLAHEVEGTAEIWELYKGIEDLKVQKLPRARFGLTTPAAKLYSASMLHSQKRLLAEESLVRGPGNGYFYLGDIFCEAQSLNTTSPSRAFVVITPACDMVRPESMAGMNILLCEGVVTDFVPGEIPNARGALPVVIMPNPRDSEKSILITWDRKRIHVWDDEERNKFKGADCHYVRIGRLRPVYAVQLQHAVTSDLSRIGTQRPPSMLAPRHVRSYVSDGTRWKLIFKSDSLDAGALAELVDDDDTYVTYVLSDPAVGKILENLSSWLDANSTADKVDILRKVSGDAIVDALQGFRQKVPKPNRDKNDVTAFPLEEINEIGKVVAFVPGRQAVTPFQTIRNASKTKKDRDTRLLIVFEDDLTAEEPADFDPNAAKPMAAETSVQAAEGTLTAICPTYIGPTADIQVPPAATAA
ncbi:hypothetical protein [Rhodoferax sp. GW822-FHT02A01]|uniref:hypothetical protein n=1 Tax=Rhodoferax sp. GW822-FHT02A01 TaxID=3141537 RepID=UPI00315CB036